ncbi:hypothetical protein ScPMuIL_005605 [Solemya velum]
MRSSTTSCHVWRENTQWSITHGSIPVLSPVTVKHIVREWLKEDTPSFDYGGFVVGEKEETAVLLMKSPGVLAGRPFVDAIFRNLNVGSSGQQARGPGSIKQAVKDAKVVGGFSTKIEVECRSLEEATEASEAGCDVVMLDNFSPEAVSEVASTLKKQFPSLLIEVSGGITEENLSSYCDRNVDVLSLSKLTQGYATVDFSFKISKDGRDPRNLTVKL